MFMNFFNELRQAKVPVTLKEYLMLIEALDRDVIDKTIDDFYYLSRAALVKDERNLDKFDQVFGHVFKGLEKLGDGAVSDIPTAWLQALSDKFLTPEEREQIEAMGGFDKLMEMLAERMREQKEEGENGDGDKDGKGGGRGKGGSSPFGADGFHPEGIRIGQDKGRHGKAIKVWDKRDYTRTSTTAVELGTRNIKVALRRLRRIRPPGPAGRAGYRRHHQGVRPTRAISTSIMRPERRNTIKVLLVLRHRRLHG